MFGWFIDKMEELKTNWKSKGLSDEEINSILGFDNDSDAGSGGEPS